MNREKFAYLLSKFTQIFTQVLFIGLLITLTFFGVQLYKNNKLLLQISKSNEAKLDEALPLPFPIKFDTPQNVLREPPVFHLDEPIDVEARFLNETDAPVSLSADIHWVLVTEAKDLGYVEPIQVGLFMTLRPGCTKIPFSNKRPQAVVRVTQRLFNAGIEKVTWRLTGYNQLIAPTLGGKQKFDVDNFSYIPDSVPLPENRTEHIPETCDTL